MLDNIARAAIETAMTQVRRSLESSVDALKHDSRMNQIIETHQALNKFEDMLGIKKTSLAQVFGLNQEDEKGDTTIRPDEFYGYKSLEAAKLFLKKKGRACSLSEIVAGVRAGGGIVENEEELGRALARSTYQIAKIGDNYGLLEFYPHIQRGRSKRKRATSEATGADEMLEAQAEADIAEAERQNEEYEAEQEAQVQAAIAASEEAAG